MFDARDEIDGSVTGFRALDYANIYTLRADKTLWRVAVGNPNTFHQVDGNVADFQPLDTTTVYVLGTDGNLCARLVITRTVPP